LRDAWLQPATNRRETGFPCTGLPERRDVGTTTTGPRPARRTNTKEETDMKRTFTGDLSRRGLLKGASALGAASLILPAGMRKAQAEPNAGGILRIGMGHGNTGDSLDPAIWDNAYVQVLASAIHNYLTEIDTDGSLIPEIAESWEASADAATWTFVIRRA
jgi:hypothetical protein